MKWIFKENVEELPTSEDFWYALNDGGYIKPEEIIADPKQLEELQKAIALVLDFEQELVDSGIMTEM